MTTERWIGGVRAAFLGATSSVLQGRLHRHHRHHADHGGRRMALLPLSTATTAVMLVGAATAGTCWILTGLGRIKMGGGKKTVMMGGSVRSNSHDDGIQSKKKKKKKKGRRLGFLERWYVAHSRAGMHTGFVIGMELSATAVTAGVPDVETLRIRLQIVASKFPWLRCKPGCKVKRDGVQGADSRTLLTAPTTDDDDDDDKSSACLWGDDLYAEMMDEAEMRQPAVRHVVLTGSIDGGAPDNNGLQQVFQEESVQEWHDEDPSQPLWRATLVTWENGSPSRRFALVLSFHHLITDGMGALEVARAIVNPNHYSVPVEHQDNELPPPLEDVMDTVPTLSHMVRVLFWYSFPRVAKWLYPDHWRGSTVHREVATVADRATELFCFTLLKDAETLRTCYCRPRNLSLNSVLVATLCEAVSRTVSPSPMMRFKIQLAADERRRCSPPVPAHRLGTYVTGPQLHVTVKESGTIDAVGRDFSNKLRRALEVSPMDMGMCRFIDEDWISFATRLGSEKPNGVHDSLEVSLMNRVEDFPVSDDDGDFFAAVDRLWFVQGRRGFGPAIIVATANTGLELNASLASFPDAVPREQLQEIARRWKDELSSLVPPF